MNASHQGAIDLVNAGKGIGAALFSDAAARHDGATTFWFGPSQGVITAQEREVIVDSAVLNESALGSVIVRDKGLTKRFLEANGIRTPAGETVASLEGAVRIANTIGYPVVLKPSRGGHGKGVTVDINTDNEVREAYIRARKHTKGRILIEDYIPIQDEYRCMASDSSCEAVVHRKLPMVTGDGVSSIFELIREKNMVRKANPALHNLLIPIDDIVKTTVARQGHRLEDILSCGTEVTVRNVGGLSGGGEPHERSEDVSKNLKNLAKRAIAAIPGLRWGGVDVVVARESEQPYVIEINTCAGYGAATFPLGGTPVDVASVAWHKRKELSSPDSQIPRVGAPSIKRSPFKTIHSTLDISLANEHMKLSEIFTHWAVSTGFMYENHGGVMRLIADPGEHWISGALDTAEDFLAVNRILRRHTWVRALHARKRVLRPRGRLVRDARSCEEFMDSIDNAATAIPVDKPWDAAEARTLDSGAPRDLFPSKKPWFIQSTPGARQVRVYATRASVIAATVPSDSLRLSTSSAQLVSDAAVDAIRAVPELCWGVVDLSLLSAGSKTREAYRPVVEGISRNPLVSRDDKIIMGDIVPLFRRILEVSYRGPSTYPTAPAPLIKSDS